MKPKPKTTNPKVKSVKPAKTPPPNVNTVFLNPIIDWAFKRIFGSVESVDILLRFLNDLLYPATNVIRSLTITDPYLPSKLKHLKKTSVDVRAVLDTGAEILIEMQLYPVSGFTQRLTFNGAKAVACQLTDGDNYRKLRPVTVISISDCTIVSDRKEWLSHYTMLEKTAKTPCPTGSIDVVLIELPKVDTSALPANHPFREWLSFLISANTWSTIPSEIKNPAIRKALRLARRNNLTKKESELMSRRELFYWDQVNAIDLANEQGEARGEARGEAKKQTEMVLALVKAGVELNTICQASGLSPAEIKALTDGSGGNDTRAKARNSASKRKAKA